MGEVTWDRSKMLKLYMFACLFYLNHVIRTPTYCVTGLYPTSTFRSHTSEEPFYQSWAVLSKGGSFHGLAHRLDQPVQHQVAGLMCIGSVDCRPRWHRRLEVRGDAC